MVLPQQQGGAGGLAFGGSKGPGLGVTRALLQQGAKALGITFQPLQGNVLSGKSADGSITIKLTGPPEGLTEIVVKASGSMQQIMGSMQSIGAVAAMIAPWSTQWLVENSAALMSGAPLQKTQDGVLLKLEVAQQPPGLTFTMRSV